ncbi:MAG: helix-turn-helix domain-containing protein [Liquorilactobacillus hordei]|uniref:helix-turn-helix domain-containing protein n=1 Tax=Liquorilactobacillus hordei TaxID=468911 RepID=UPI0039E7733D
MAEQPSYFSILTASVRYDPRLKKFADEKVLFSEITALSNKYGYCTASNKYFSRLYDRPIPTISKWINHLKELGYLKVEMVREGKEIKQRKLFPNANPIHADVNTYSRRTEGGIHADVKGGINVDVKENNTSINNTSINKTHSAAKPAQLVLKEEFELLWKNYPNKKGKNAAFNHYKAWRKKSVKNVNEYLEKKLADYLRYCALHKDWYHPMNGSTWFNGRFNDELDLGGARNDPWSKHYE